MFARACVTLTARGALARGFEVYALEDAIACASDATRARAVARLAQRGVHVVREAGRDDPADADNFPRVSEIRGPALDLCALYNSCRACENYML